jgi:predicted Zn-dependent protease
MMAVSCGRVEMRQDSRTRCLALAVVFCVSVSLAGESRIIVSPAQEVAWGEKALRDFLQSRGQTRDGKLAVRVDRIGRSVARVSDRRELSYRFVVVKGRDLQAFSFPGGTVCLTEALARLYETEDELAFVVAHELSHIALRHHASQLRMQQMLASGAPGEKALLETIKSAMDRDSEFEADRYGALYAVRAGYRFTKTYEAIKTLSKAMGDEQEDSSHAPFSERIAGVKDFRVELERSLDAFDHGLDAIESGTPDEAIGALRLFIAQFPESVSGRVNLGTAHLAVVQLSSGALQGLSEPLPVLRIRDVPPLRGPLDKLGLEQARSNFNHVLSNHPDHVVASIGMVLVHLRLDELDKARELLEQATMREPMNPELVLAMGNVQYLGKDYSAALASYTKALSIATDTAAVRKNVALTLEKLGLNEEARDHWKLVADDRRFNAGAKRRLADPGQE